MNTALLWKKIQKGNKNAFNQLFKLYYGDLKAYGIKISGSEVFAQEAIQLLFVKLWEKRASLNEVATVKSYLIRAYRRILVDLLQKEKKQSQKTNQVSIFQISLSVTSNRAIYNNMKEI